MRRPTVKKVTRTKTVAYDVVEQLRTPAEMAAYLDAWLAEAPDDSAGIARALGQIARAKGMSQVARDSGLSRESLYKALREDGNPSFATVLKVARALGVRLHAGAELSGVGFRDDRPHGRYERWAATRQDVASKTGISFHSRPSSSRPARFFCVPPHCLKKKGTPRSAHWRLMDRTHPGSIGLHPGPLSPPTTTQ